MTSIKFVQTKSLKCLVNIDNIAIFAEIITPLAYACPLLDNGLAYPKAFFIMKNRPNTSYTETPIRVAILIDGGYFIKRYNTLYNKLGDKSPETIASDLYTISHSHVGKNNYLYIELPYDLDKRDILTNLHFLFNRYFSWANILKYYLKMKSANCRIISEHINFFTPYSINKLLEINGFRIVHSSVKKIDQTWCKSSIISVLAVRDF